MWHGVPFARQRRPIIGVLRMCWISRIPHETTHNLQLESWNGPRFTDVLSHCKNSRVWWPSTLPSTGSFVQDTDTFVQDKKNPGFLISVHSRNLAGLLQKLQATGEHTLLVRKQEIWAFHVQSKQCHTPELATPGLVHNWQMYWPAVQQGGAADHAAGARPRDG